MGSSGQAFFQTPVKIHPGRRQGNPRKRKQRADLTPVVAGLIAVIPDVMVCVYQKPGQQLHPCDARCPKDRFTPQGQVCFAQFT